MTQPAFVLGYWGIRGLAQQIRNLLEYLHLPYEDKIYQNRDDWSLDKPKLQTDFPNLPYLIDNGKVISQSEAIMLHIALKANREDLIGSTKEEKVHFTQVQGVLRDIRIDFNSIIANKATQDLQKKFNQKVFPQINYVSNHLRNQEFLIGNLSLVDFGFAEMLRAILMQEGEWVGGLSNLKPYYDRVNNLPGLKEYNISERAQPFYSSPDFVNPHFKLSY